VIVFAGLMAGASAAMRGGGLFFAVVAGALWIGVPLWRFAQTLSRAASVESGRWFTLAWRLALLVVFGATALFVPFHRAVSSAGVIELADTVVLRTECPGFVEAVHVRDG